MQAVTRRFIMENVAVALAMICGGVAIGHYFGILGGLVIPIPIVLVFRSYLTGLGRRNRSFWQSSRTESEIPPVTSEPRAGKNQG